MTLLAIFGCAPASRELPATLEGLAIEATVEQTTEQHGSAGEGFTTNHVRAVLLDKGGHTLEREDLIVEMNDTPLAMRTGHGNFYDRHPFYRLDDAAAHLAPDTECAFTLVRPDGTHHRAGIVRTPRLLVAAQFDFPAAISRTVPVAISWTELAEAAELVVFRTLQHVNAGGETVIEGGSPGDPEALRRTIGPGLFRRASGRLEIPQAFLADQGERRVTSIGVEISVTHTGEVRDAFSRKSTLTATRRLVLHAEVVD